MTNSKRSELPRRRFGLACLLAVSALILCVTAEADDTVFGPEPRPAKKPSAAATAPEPASPPLQLVEIFSVEQNPGSGTLEYQTPTEAPQKIPFGSASGIYGLAMAFKGKNLPDQYGKNFKADLIIQMALGTLKSKLEAQVPQWAAATLIGPGVPIDKVRYPVVVPQEGKTNFARAMSLLLFTLPNTPNELSDEQKLRSTFFAQAGSLDLRATGMPKFVDVQAQGKTLRFKMYPIEMGVNVTLGTPFSAQAGTLKGKVQLPLYSPYGKPAEEFTQRIAGESLEGTMKARNTASTPKK